MKKIDSDALGVLNKSLGLTGAGSPITELEDGIVGQSVNVNEVARRGRTIAKSQGIYTAVMRNIHVGASTVTTSVDPYRVGLLIAAAGYPVRIPEQFDLWLLTATVVRSAGVSSLAGVLRLDYGAAHGWGIDNLGAAILATGSMAVAHFQSVATIAGTFGVNSANGLPVFKLGMRLPRDDNTSLEWSTTGTDSTFDLQLVLGLYPASLGQDGLV